MKNYLRNVTAFLLISLSLDLYAQQDKATCRLDSLFGSMHQSGMFNGAALVALNGKTIYQMAYGYADFSLQRLNDTHTAFALGSVSKIFTATAILQLQEKGRLQLDAPFSFYFPTFPYPAITLRHLLTHTSGLPDYEIFEKAVAHQPQKVFGNADILPALHTWSRPLAFMPGSQWRYGNLNYCLLALLVEKVTGSSFESYVRTHIFKVARMQESYFYRGASKDRPAQQAAHYEYPFFFSPQLVNADSIPALRWRTYHLSGFVGQGNMYTSTGDMLKFDQALYGHRLLRRASIEEMVTPVKLSDGSIASLESSLGKAAYGLGWFVLQDTTFGKVVFHTGGVPGAACIFLRNLTQKQALLIFDNTQSPGLFTNAASALQLLYGRQPLPVKKSLTREYANALLAEGVDAAFTKLINLQADSLHYRLSEYELNELGLQLLYAAKGVNHQLLALEVLKVNILLFPHSFNTYDSYGEALAKTGSKKQAIEMYKRSLIINPDNQGGKEALEQLLK
jgi:CubicO group peptidase (beta-lactamase class C family)